MAEVTPPRLPPCALRKEAGKRVPPPQRKTHMFQPRVQADSKLLLDPGGFSSSHALCKFRWIDW